MTARRLVEPIPAVTVAQAKMQSRVLAASTVEDGIIADHIAAAHAFVEKQTNRWYEAQEWEVVLDVYPTQEMEIIVPGPLITVDSVSYLDLDGASQLMPPTGYVADNVSDDGWILPTEGWPATLSMINAVRLVVTIGQPTPADVRHAIVMMAAHYYSEREGDGVPDGVITICKRHLRHYA